MTTKLARALTTRVRKEENTSPTSSPWIGRAASQRAPNAKPINRGQISLPVALLSTTNMLSYEAPDIVNAPHVQQMGGRYFSASSTASSADSVSGDESENSAVSIHSHETDATSLDLSSPEIGSSDKGFFKSSTASSRMTTSTTPSVMSDSVSQETPLMTEPQSPTIPTRAASHSKKAHMLSHKRSVQRMNSVRSQHSTREPAAPVSSSTATTSAHPFGRELEKLNEVAEEFNVTVRSAEQDTDIAIMQSKGLVRYCANDYLDEISSIYSSTYEEEHTYQPMVWI